MEPRAPVRPPGHPDFMSRARCLAAGPCLLDGRAWSGYGPVTRVVEVTHQRRRHLGTGHPG